MRGGRSLCCVSRIAKGLPIDRVPFLPRETLSCGGVAAADIRAKVPYMSFWKPTVLFSSVQGARPCAAVGRHEGCGARHFIFSFSRIGRISVVSRSGILRGAPAMCAHGPEDRERATCRNVDLLGESSLKVLEFHKARV